MPRISEIKRQVIRIAAPAVAGYVGLILYELIDIFWIAKLGPETVAGVASAQYCGWVIQAIMGMTTIGCATLTAQSIGAGDKDGALRVPREAAHISLVISVVLTGVFYALAPRLLGWMGLNPEAHAAGWAYFRLLILALPILHMILLAQQVFNAHGDTKTAVLIMVSALAVNAALDPVLMFGWLGFPAFGVAGAAMASLVGMTFGLILRVVFLRRRGYVGPLRSFLEFSSGYFGRIFRVGLPTSASHLIWTSVYPLLTTLITLFGMAPLAGMTIAHRFESIAYFTCVGFSIATATLVGQYVGKKDFKTAKKVAYESRTLITLLLIPVSALFVFWPEALLRITTDDPDTIAHGAAYMRRIGLLELFLGWEMVFEGGFNGLGNTRPYMLVSIPLTLGRFPAAYFCVKVLGLDVTSIWWCISISTALKGILMSWTFGRTRAAELGIGAPSSASPPEPSDL